MERQYIVLQGDDGILYPLAFITPLDEAGKIRAEDYAKRKVGKGEKLVIVDMVLVCDYNI